MTNEFRRQIVSGFVACCLAAPAAAQTTPTATRLLSLSNPSIVGAPVKLRAEVDAPGGSGAPTGWLSFWDGFTRIGFAKVGPAAGAGQATVADGGVHACALTGAGAVKCWGYNGYGQLGDGTTTNRLTPTAVAGLSSAIVAIAAGGGAHNDGGHTCALTRAGAVLCWGRNFYGQLGDGTTTDRSTPTPITRLARGVVAIAAGRNHTCALTGAGFVLCWGRNEYGQLGDGTYVNRSTPTPTSVVSGGNVAITGGSAHTCALTSAGAVRCWGNNSEGQLGDGSLSSGIAAVAAGAHHTCALTNAGAAKCWGANDSGQLGDGTTTWRWKPTAVLGLSSGVVAITAGGWHTCALTSAGAALCWGYNGTGGLGDGTTTNRSTPVPVTGLSSGVSTIVGSDYASHTCALTSAGAARCWGYNGNGQVGDGATMNRLTPVATKNLTPLIRARAEFVTPPLASGMHWLRAYYRGDATHASSLGDWRQTVR